MAWSETFNYEVGLGTLDIPGAERLEYWFLLSILVAFLWGASGVFSKYATPKIGILGVAMLIIAVEGIMYSTAFLFWRESIHISLDYALLALGSCMVGIIGYLCFFESLMQGQVAIAGTISAAYPALAVLGAVVLLSENLSSAQGIGVIAIIAGIIALSYEPNPGSKTAMSKKTLGYALAAFAFWGLWSFSSKVAVDGIGAGNLFLFYASSALITPSLYILIRRERLQAQRPSYRPRNAWILGGTGLAINVAGAYAFSFALETGTASLVVPISSAYPVITVILAIAFLRERIHKVHILPLALVIVGLVMIGLTI